MHTAFQEKATDWAANPSPTSCVDPYKRAPRIKLLLIKLRLSPIQLQLYGYILIHIFTNQSEQLHSGQSRPNAIWTN